MGYENKSVVEIETIKTEINFLLKAYKDTLDNYISNLRNQLNDKASNDLSNLNDSLAYEQIFFQLWNKIENEMRLIQHAMENLDN